MYEYLLVAFILIFSGVDAIIFLAGFWIAAGRPAPAFRNAFLASLALAFLVDMLIWWQGSASENGFILAVGFAVLECAIGAALALLVARLVTALRSRRAN